MKKAWLFLILAAPLLAYSQSAKNDNAKDQPKSSSTVFEKITPPEPIVRRCYNVPSSSDSSKTPLIVVDNYVYEGSLKDLQPSEIKSITILKDAAASSIWGCRTGNGVIIIQTTKLDSVLKRRKATLKGRILYPSTNTRTQKMLIAVHQAKDQLRIQTTSFSAHFDLQLVNMQGQQLRKWRNLNASSPLQEFNIAGVPPGVYLAVVQTKGKQFAEKLWIGQ